MELEADHEQIPHALTVQPPAASHVRPTVLHRGLLRAARKLLQASRRQASKRPQVAASFSTASARLPKSALTLGRNRKRSKCSTSSTWKSGPLTVDDALMWPAHFSKAMQDNRLRCGFFERLVETLGKGLDMSTDYSGVGQPEISMNNIVAHLRQIGMNVGQGVRCVRASDISAVCRRVLLAHVDGPEHVHGDLLHRVPDSFGLAVQQAVATCKEHAENMIASGERPAISYKWTGQMMEDKLVALLKHVGRDSEPMLAKCFRCNKKCRISASPEGDRLSLHVAGICCYDWSSRGKRRGWSGATSIVFAEWLRERRVLAEDIIIVECTRDFKPKVPQLLTPAMLANTAAITR